MRVRLVGILIAVGVLVAGAAMWGYDVSQQRRLEGGVRILALKKFEPFVVRWAKQHANDFSHEILIDIADTQRFRQELQLDNDQYDAFIVDSYGSSAITLRKQGRLRNFFGGPLKLLARDGVAESAELSELWPLLEGKVVGVLPTDTPLGRDTDLWFQLADIKSAGSGPKLQIYSRTLDLLQALHRADVDAAVLRADLQDPPETEGIAWHKLKGRPQDTYEMGMLVLTSSPHRELMRDIWLDIQPEFLRHQLSK
ncbi:MAG: hypothetical protein HQ519_05780 [Planctomycetes bacterium]|nr:hypothetical protein [Planctomycetota bacterium]